MNYPFWDADIGYGLLMGTVAVLHVFVSHFAIGGGLYLVLAETYARKNGDTLTLKFLERLSKFFILTTLVTGALTGVGIWFIVGLLSPAGTEVLIHHFFWGWATEWVFFTIEICAAIIYFYGWRPMSARDHLVVGWIYFGAAWVSLFIINGIITFMLTPGDWLNTGSFWDGFFNPTFWPSLVFRTGICTMLAGLFSLAVASRLKADAFKSRLVRYNAVWGITGLIVMAPSFLWYIISIPPDVRSAAEETMPFAMARADHTIWFAAAIIFMLVFFGLMVPKRYSTPIGIAVLTLGVIWFGQYEWFREAVRKPYIIYDYMYGNEVELARIDTFNSDGYLEHTDFRTGDDGADLFRHTCRSCHTLKGYKALKPWLDGTDEEYIAGIVRGVGVMKGNMPPFHGKRVESQLIAGHLYHQLDHRHIGEIYNLTGPELGKKVYEIRCSGCHEFGGYNDKAESLIGLHREDYNDLLDIAGELGEEMPDFTGDNVERTALIDYLIALGEGGIHVPAGL